MHTITPLRGCPLLTCWTLRPEIKKGPLCHVNGVISAIRTGFRRKGICKTTTCITPSMFIRVAIMSFCSASGTEKFARLDFCSHVRSPFSCWTGNHPLSLSGCVSIFQFYTLGESMLKVSVSSFVSALWTNDYLILKFTR